MATVYGTEATKVRARSYPNPARSGGDVVAVLDSVTVDSSTDYAVMGGADVSKDAALLRVVVDSEAVGAGSTCNVLGTMRKPLPGTINSLYPQWAISRSTASASRTTYVNASTPTLSEDDYHVLIRFLVLPSSSGSMSTTLLYAKTA